MAADLAELRRHPELVYSLEGSLSGQGQSGSENQGAIPLRDGDDESSRLGSPANAATTRQLQSPTSPCATAGSREIRHRGASAAENFQGEQQVQRTSTDRQSCSLTRSHSYPSGDSAVATSWLFGMLSLRETGDERFRGSLRYDT